MPLYLLFIKLKHITIIITLKTQNTFRSKINTNFIKISLNCGILLFFKFDINLYNTRKKKEK